MTCLKFVQVRLKQNDIENVETLVVQSKLNFKNPYGLDMSEEVRTAPLEVRVFLQCMCCHTLSYTFSLKCQRERLPSPVLLRYCCVRSLACSSTTSGTPLPGTYAKKPNAGGKGVSSCS